MAHPIPSPSASSAHCPLPKALRPFHVLSRDNRGLGEAHIISDLVSGGYKWYLFPAQPLALILRHLEGWPVELIAIFIALFQLGILQGIIETAETGVSLVIHGTVLEWAARF